MKNFLAALLFLGAFCLVGCEKTTGEKVDDAAGEMEKKADEMKKDMKKIAE